MKKIVSVFILVAMLVSLVGCGDRNETPHQETLPSVTPAPTPVATAEASPEATPTASQVSTPEKTPTATPAPTEATPGSSAPPNPPPGTSGATDIETILSKYSGRWYLDGYADVYVDIGKDGNGWLSIKTTNFVFSAEKGNVVYPSGNEDRVGRISGLGISPPVKYELEAQKIKFTNNAIYFNTHKFISTPAGTPPAPDPTPSASQSPTNNGYSCSCGFTCTICSVNNGQCAHYTLHYKDHPEACPHYHNGNPEDDWCIYYQCSSENIEYHYKTCNLCDKVWPEEKHSMVVDNESSVAGDCTTSKIVAEKCTICNYSKQAYLGYQHADSEWFYIDEPCGTFPHYKKHCSLCDKYYDYKAPDGPVTAVPCQGGTATCSEKAICKWCNKPYGDFGKHLNTEIRNAKEATCSEGYSGDVYCLDCNKLAEKGSEIPAVRDHAWIVLETSKPGYVVYKKSQCQECGTTTTVSIQ